MLQLIVVEGPDGAGKSTLAHQLANALGLPIAPKVVSSQGHILTNLKEWVENNVALGFQRRLFDRHRLISGPIYNAVLGRSDPAFYDLGWMHCQMQLFHECHPLIIYCLPPFDLVERNVMEGEADNTLVDKHIRTLYDLYVARAALDIVDGRGIVFDYSRDGNWTSVVNQATKHLEGMYV